MATLRVLVIEDDDDLRTVSTALLRAADYEVDAAACAEDALALAARNRYDGVLCDMMLGESNGLDVMEAIKGIQSQAEVIIATGYASVETAVSAMRRGAFQYLAKPVNTQELLLLMERATRKSRDAFDKDLMAERLRRRDAEHGIRGLVAADDAMIEAIAEARDIAVIDKPVFIHGETGTGKEVIAQLVHRASARCDGPFNVLNCGTLTENLVDAELFGYVKGAFTGADQSRPGIIAASHEGTLFLDEIGDINPAAQVRLLRFLESGVVRPVGSTREERLDVRIVAATHRDLPAEVSAGRFREDLYHRLVVFEVELPPLRNRPADIQPLVEHFLSSMDRTEPGTWSVSTEAVKLLQQQPWNGNVRELRNETERAWLRAQRRGSTRLEPVDFRLSASAPERPEDFAGYGPIPMSQAELLHVRHVLNLCDDNRRRAADVLGVSERHIYRLLRQAQTLDEVESK
ncbi:MAG: sigma-54 dependent transcriptional regulator [Planctomycetota bacterium]|jgi:DNA-binding NtrC family response regulator|nr:sigma-54 dependent transcriptional regulator [Planctomycetota bacterium]